MEEASFETLETPPQKEKAPGDNAAAEEDTATDTDRPTEIDQSETAQAPKEQLSHRK